MFLPLPSTLHFTNSKCAVVVACKDFFEAAAEWLTAGKTLPMMLALHQELDSVDDLVHESPKRRLEKVIQNYKDGHFPFKLLQAIA